MVSHAKSPGAMPGLCCRGDEPLVVGPVTAQLQAHVRIGIAADILTAFVDRHESAGRACESSPCRSIGHGSCAGGRLRGDKLVLVGLPEGDRNVSDRVSPCADVNKKPKLVAERRFTLGDKPFSAL